jgi:hypothetical protein
MYPRHLWSNKKARRLGVVAALFSIAAIGCCVFFRITRPADIEAYRGMASECHPIWKQFALRRFGAGDSTAELLRRFSPDRREEFGRYGIYSYYAGAGGIPFTSLRVVTRDGKLLSAESGSCTWRFSFFRTEDPELDRQFAELVQGRIAESNRKEQKN